MKHFAPYLAAVLFCALISFSCVRQDVKPPVLAGPIDPTTDLVACTDPVQHILYVLPDHKDMVLRELNATTMNGEWYSMSAIAASGRTVPFTFLVKTADISRLLLETADQEYIRWMLHRYDEASARDTTRGQFIGKLDTGGVFYRVYINAQCTQVEKGHETPCEKEWWLEVTYPDSNLIRVESGKYRQFKFYDINHCLKGTGTCIEALSVRSEVRLYSAAGCAGAPLSTHVQDWDYNCVK